MNILIVGNGGREHAIAWKVAQSPRVEHIFVASGNAGTALEPKTQNIPIAPTDIPALIKFALKNDVDLTIVGPEVPLAAGITDQFIQEGLACFGPSQAAAQLESSKSFCKQFMQAHNIPTAAFATFTDVKKAIDYLKQQSFPIVIKADGLAAGKGVVIAEDFEQACDSVNSMLIDNQFGDAGARVVIEEFLSGEELSFIAIVDGEHVLPLASSQDHKRRDDGDQGPNTGGMGAYSPAPILTPGLKDKIIKEIMQPTVDGLKANGSPFIGFLYAGLMIDANGDAKVLEFNCRLGDPETQPILFRLKSDLVELCQAALSKKLNTVTLEWDPRPAIAVVLASGGYPADYRKGDAICGLDNKTHPDYKVFHAGTEQINGKIVTSGGRVLAVTALGDTLTAARDTAYTVAAHITWPDRFYRHDIGHRAL